MSHGTVKQESLMDVVGRDQARRGQPIDKPLTRPVRYRDREHDQHREEDREMLARGKELNGDNDKLLVEYQQDTDIGIESELPKLEFDQEFNQGLKDCVDELRRVSRRVPRRESLTIWFRVQVRLRESLRESLREWIRECIRECIREWIPVWIRVCRHAVRKRCAMVLINQLSLTKRDCKRMRVQVVHNRVALNISNASADSEVRGKRTTQLKRGKSQTVAMNAAKLKPAELWHLEKLDARIKSWKARVIQSGALVQNVNACRNW